MPDYTAGDSKGVDFNHPCMGVTRVKDAEDGRVEFLMPDGMTPRKKIAIVGFASSSTLDAPFDDPEYAIVGMNQLYRWIPRADAWYEMHENYHEYVVEGTDHIGWLRTCPIPIYMTKHYPEYPNSVRFPIERFSKRFGNYWTSSIAFMIAQAIDSGFERIDLFGIDLAVGDEWFYQRPCAERLLGFAEGLGITIGIPIASSLCKGSHIYGYEKDPMSNGLISTDDFAIRKAKLMKIRDTKITELNQCDGALAELDMWRGGIELRSRQATWNP